MHASLLPGQSPRLFDHFENLSFLLLGTSGVENRAHRRDSFALFSNHLANIVFRNPQFDVGRDECVCTGGKGGAGAGQPLSSKLLTLQKSEVHAYKNHAE